MSSRSSPLPAAARSSWQNSSGKPCYAFEKARVRFTTVELLVGQAPIKVKSEKYVSVQIDWNEQTLREVVKAAGARWDGNAKLWRMPRRLAGILRLTDRIADA